MNENLLMEVVRMYSERESYFEVESKKAMKHSDFLTGAVMMSKSLAYDSAREMLMAALTGNTEILREYDYFVKGKNQNGILAEK